MFMSSQKGPSLTFRFYYFSFFRTKNGKRDFGQKILSTECILLLFVARCCCVLRIEVINHRNHYFTVKCNYEFVETRGTSLSAHDRSVKVQRKPHFNNIIKFLLILLFPSSLFPHFAHRALVQLNVHNPARKFNLLKCILRSHNSEYARKTSH